MDFSREPLWGGVRSYETDSDDDNDLWSLYGGAAKRKSPAKKRKSPAKKSPSKRKSPAKSRSKSPAKKRKSPAKGRKSPPKSRSKSPAKPASPKSSRFREDYLLETAEKKKLALGQYIKNPSTGEVIGRVVHIAACGEDAICVDLSKLRGKTDKAKELRGLIKEIYDTLPVGQRDRLHVGRGNTEKLCVPKALATAANKIVELEAALGVDANEVVIGYDAGRAGAMVSLLTMAHGLLGAGIISDTWEGDDDRLEDEILAGTHFQIREDKRTRDNQVMVNALNRMVAKYSKTRVASAKEAREVQQAANVAKHGKEGLIADAIAAIKKQLPSKPTFVEHLKKVFRGDGDMDSDLTELEIRHIATDIVDKASLASSAKTYDEAIRLCGDASPIKSTKYGKGYRCVSKYITGYGGEDNGPSIKDRFEDSADSKQAVVLSASQRSVLDAFTAALKASTKRSTGPRLS